MLWYCHNYKREQVSSKAQSYTISMIDCTSFVQVRWKDPSDVAPTIMIPKRSQNCKNKITYIGNSSCFMCRVCSSSFTYGISSSGATCAHDATDFCIAWRVSALLDIVAALMYSSVSLKSELVVLWFTLVLSITCLNSENELTRTLC